MMNASDNNASCHRKTWDLIPWIVNGRCPEHERRRAEQHLADCADCRAELEFQRELRKEVRYEQAEAERDPRPALQRLWARIDAEQVRPSLHTTVNGHGYRRLLVRGLVAAVVAEAIGLAMLSATLWLHTEEAARYHTLSTPAAPAQRATIRAVFAPTLTRAAVQALLAQERLQIVAGTNAAGVYALAPLSVQNDDARAKTLIRLRSQPGVLFAEPIEPGG